MPKQRNSSFELIRILCIFFVVFWHSIGPYTNDLSTGNLVGSSFVNTLTNNTNLLFMMVSGYFGIRFNLEKLIKLDIAIIFYDLLHLFLFGEFGIKSLIIACMPITFKSHWFISYYFVITILSSFLNKIPEQLDRRSFRNLILLLLFLFYVIPTVFFYEIIEDARKRCRMYDDYVSDRPLYPPVLKRSLFFTKETCRRVLFGIDSCHRAKYHPFLKKRSIYRYVLS